MTRALSIPRLSASAPGTQNASVESHPCYPTQAAEGTTSRIRPLETVGM